MQNNVKARTTDHIIERLRTEISAEVHSVFRHVINVKTPFGLVALQDEHVPFTPFAIVLESEDFPDPSRVDAGDSVVLNDHSIQVAERKIDILHYLVIDDRIQRRSGAVPRQSVYGMIDLLTAVLRDDELKDMGLGDFAVHIAIRSGRIKPFHGGPDRVRAFAADKLSDVTCDAQLPETLMALIGLGQGLTPSMDDFLVGFLSVLYWMADHDFAKEILKGFHAIEDSLKGTTLVSAAFLHHAAIGRFSEPLVELYQQLNRYPQYEGKIQNALQSIVRVGHSSGVDALNGILFGFILMETCPDA